MVTATAASGSEAARLARYRDSVLVTGGHYSLTSVIGVLLARSPHFHTLMEPFNRDPPLWYRTIGNGYEYYDRSRYAQLRTRLIRIMNGDGIARAVAARRHAIGSFSDAAQIARLVARELEFRLRPKPAIFKGPFMLFSAHMMQQHDGIRVVVGTRHPCAWIESIVRRDEGFEFTQLQQPALLRLLPDFADEIDWAVRAEPPALDCAILAWRAMRTFLVRYLCGNPRTFLLRQEDLVGDPLGSVDRLFGFVGVVPPRGIDRLVREAVGGQAIDVKQGSGGPYARRDGSAVLAKWRARLTAADQARIRRETEELAKAFGYSEADWAGIARRG